MLEFHQVRTKESGRALAIQLVSAELGLAAPEMAAVVRAHGRRNETSYRSPFPPLSKADARTMVEILGKYLPAVRALAKATDVSRPAGPGE
ncbi:MAG: hypothetical protein JO224_13600 [Pelomonas sp.]|nr:hypothetical protein [Roseateles sp.]